MGESKNSNTGGSGSAVATSHETSWRVVAVTCGTVGVLKADQNGEEMLQFLESMGFMSDRLMTSNEFVIRCPQVSADKSLRGLHCQLVRYVTAPQEKQFKLDEGSITDFCAHPREPGLHLFAFGGRRSSSWVFACIPKSSPRRLTRLGRMSPNYPNAFTLGPQFMESDSPATKTPVDPARPALAPMAEVAQRPVEVPAPVAKPKPVAATSPVAVTPTPAIQKEIMKELTGKNAPLISRALELVAIELDISRDDIRSGTARVHTLGKKIVWYVLYQRGLTDAEIVIVAHPPQKPTSVYQTRLSITKLLEEKDERVTSIVKKVTGILDKEFPATAAPSSEPGRPAEQEPAARLPKVPKPPKSAAEASAVVASNGHVEFDSTAMEDIVVCAILGSEPSSESVHHLAAASGVGINDIYASLGRGSVLLREKHPRILQLLKGAGSLSKIKA